MTIATSASTTTSTGTAPSATASATPATTTATSRSSGPYPVVGKSDPSGAVAPDVSLIRTSLSPIRCVECSRRPFAALDRTPGSHAGERVGLEHVLDIHELGRLVQLERLCYDLGDSRPGEVTGQESRHCDLVGGVQPSRRAARGAACLVGEA